MTLLLKNRLSKATDTRRQNLLSRHAATLIILMCVLALTGCRKEDKADAAGSLYEWDVNDPSVSGTAPGSASSGSQDYEPRTVTGVDADASISVVVTNFPCYDFARACLGDMIDEAAGDDEFALSADLKLLIKPGAEVHSYDPSPADIIAIQNADIFIYIGGESDEWIETMLGANPAKAGQIQLRLIDYVETMLDDGGDADEHIWTAPDNAAFLTGLIGDALTHTCARKAASFGDEYANVATTLIQENSAAYQRAIQEAGREIESVVNAASVKKIVMGDRFPLAYFAHYYALEYDAAFDGCSTAVEASTATLARLIEEVRKDRLPAVFYIELSTHKIADTIAEAAGVKTLQLNSIQNVPLKEFEAGETWVSLMKKNAQVLKEGLR
ncbi:MAG: zinc ABC transporter substrate-binding protein [Treponema sp.]|nr:zinc ABC transporter substrate-binding protein [Candidatus Treponema caballi]